MKGIPVEKAGFRQGVVAGMGVLSINLSTVTKLVSPQTLGLLEVFSGEKKSVIGAMKSGGEKSLEALESLRHSIDRRNAFLPKFKKISYTLSTVVPDEVEGQRIDSVIVDAAGVRISFPSVRGIPVTEKWKNGRKSFSTPSFWRIEIFLDPSRHCLITFQIYGCYKSENEWLGVWKPKTSKSRGSIIGSVRVNADNADNDICEVVRQTGVTRAVLLSRLSQAERLLGT